MAAQLLGTLQAGREGIAYLENCIQQGELNLSDLVILDNLSEMLCALESSILQSSPPNRVKEINANILYYIERLKENAIHDNVDVFLYDFRFHFLSLFRILEFEIAYVVENFVNKQNYPHLYPEVGEVDHNTIARRGQEAKCKVSVILLAYNNLSYTRDCVESILMNTDDVDYELILVDNGSTDGTKEYFDSIPGAKVIHLKYNVHLVKGFNIGLMAAEGKYSAAVCNDFIFTPNWLKNLMICIESDQKIGFVSPGATSISNMQQIDIPFVSKADFQEKARQYNISNPAKWEERVVLLPNVLCCPTALLERIGYYDTRYYRGEFLDDDISFRIRRSGYKLIYCADTVTHHYGSLTTTSDHLTNSMEEGRQTFIDRYGLDAWMDARMHPAYMHFDYPSLSEVKSILGVDAKCGATLIQIKNRIWATHGIKPKVSFCTFDQKYMTDLYSISHDVLLLDKLLDLPAELHDKYDLVFIEKPLNHFSEDLDMIFSKLAKVMNAGARLIFMVSNSISIETIYEMLNSSSAVHNRKIYNRDMLLLQARSNGFEAVSVINTMSDRSPVTNQIVEGIAMLLAGGREVEAKHVESLLKMDYGLYQMNYRANSNAF
ncbi:glycosyltransferase family 2 protein [Paenibacillus terreus]